MTQAAFWNKIADKYARDPITNMPAYVETRDRIREILRPEHRVLELGCGTGSTAFELADQVDAYLATDISDAMIDIADAKKTIDSPDHLRFEVGDAATLTAGSYDVVLALNLFHLVPDLEGVLDAIFDALPSGGLLIAKTALLKSAPWYVRAAIPLMQWIGKAPYAKSLDAYEWTDMLERSGFSVTEILIQDGLAPRSFTVARKP